MELNESKIFGQKIKDVKNNPGLLIFYAKQSCKKCYGRGYSVLNNDKILCSCVVKSIEKEIKSIRDG